MQLCLYYVPSSMSSSASRKTQRCNSLLKILPWFFNVYYIKQKSINHRRVPQKASPLGSMSCPFSGQCLCPPRHFLLPPYPAVLPQIECTFQYAASLQMPLSPTLPTLAMLSQFQWHWNTFIQLTRAVSLPGSPHWTPYYLRAENLPYLSLYFRNLAQWLAFEEQTVDNCWLTKRQDRYDWNREGVKICYSPCLSSFS